MSTRKTYEIGDRKFYQDKLVPGQMEHLFKLLRNVGEFSMDTASVIDMVTKRLDVLAVVIVPEGQTRGQHVQTLDNAGTKEIEEFLRGECDWTVIVQIVHDFFDCNPVSVLFSAVTGLQEKLGGGLLMPSRTSSKTSTSPSPADASVTAPLPESVLR